MPALSPRSAFVLLVGTFLSLLLISDGSAKPVASREGRLPPRKVRYDAATETRGVAVLRTVFKVVSTPLRFGAYVAYYSVRGPQRVVEYMAYGETGEDVGRIPDNGEKGIGPVVW